MARGGKAFKAVAKGMAVVASAAAVIERRRRAAMAADPHELAVPLHADGHVPALAEAPGSVPVPVPRTDPAPAQVVPTGSAVAAVAETPASAAHTPAAPAAHAGLGRDYHPGRPATPAEAVPWGLRVAAERPGGCCCSAPRSTSSSTWSTCCGWSPSRCWPRC